MRLHQYQVDQLRKLPDNNSIPVLCSSRRHLLKQNNNNQGQPGVNNTNLIQLTDNYDFPSLINTNVQSLVPNIDELLTRVIAERPTIVCVTESWLKRTVSDNVLNLEGYNIPIRRDRTTIVGGRVCCYIQKGTPFKVWKELEDQTWSQSGSQFVPQSYLNRYHTSPSV